MPGHCKLGTERQDIYLVVQGKEPMCMVMWYKYADLLLIYKAAYSFALLYLVGSGKTLLTYVAGTHQHLPEVFITLIQQRTVVIRHLIETSKYINSCVAHFFYDHSNKSRLACSHLFRSYIKQLIGFLDRVRLACPQHVVSHIKRVFHPDQDHPNFDEIIDVFILLNELLRKHRRRAIYVVDGLDECQSSDRRMVLEVF